jgi:hypothetical protein
MHRIVVGNSQFVLTEGNSAACKYLNVVCVTIANVAKMPNTMLNAISAAHRDESVIPTLRYQIPARDCE